MKFYTKTILVFFVILMICNAICGASQPNIIFILADDLGWADLGCYGSSFYETPNLDKLARDGAKFTQAYAACSVCSPTRASILTGKYPARLGITDWLPGRVDRRDQKLKRPPIQQFLPLEEFTIAEALKARGYQTAFIGKWHLGESPEHWPEHQGFDVNIGGSGHGHPPSYFSPYRLSNLVEGPKGEYLNDRLTDEALKFIVQAKDKPFFIYLPHYAVHTPLQAKPHVIEKYKAKALKVSSGIPEFITDKGSKIRQIQNHPTYAAMVESLDENVGRIMEKLTELGIDDKTIIVFTSDNGGLSSSNGSPTANLPLRGGKGLAYEGGIREPLLVKWPRAIQAGSVCSEPITSTDFFPTLLEIAGQAVQPEQHIDGRSFVPAMRGEIQAERPLFWHYPHYSNQGGAPNGAVRLGDFKLIEWYEDMQVELYNLKNDIGEQNDLAKTMPEKVVELRTLLQNWRSSINAKMPTPNADFDSNAKPLEKKKR